MKRQSRLEIIVGLFILASLVVGLILIVSIAQRQHFFGKRHIIYATFEDVAGLKQGAPVFLAGVGAGTVRALSINPDGEVRVRLDIQGGFTKNITVDSVAKIGSVGLLGDKSIEISVGSEGTYPLAPGSEIKTVPAFSFSRIFEDAAPLTGKLQQILNDLSEVAATLNEEKDVMRENLQGAAGVLRALNEGRGTVGKLLEDDRLYRNLNEAAFESGRAALAAAKATDRILPLLEDIRETAAAVRESSRDFPEIVRSASGLLDTAAAAADRLESVSGDLSRASTQLPDIVSSFGKSARNIEEASRELPETARNLSEAIRNADSLIEGAKGNWLLKGSFPEGGETPPMEVERR